MNTASKVRAIMNLIALIVGIILTVLSIIALVQMGSLNDSLTQLQELLISR